MRRPATSILLLVICCLWPSEGAYNMCLPLARSRCRGLRGARYAQCLSMVYHICTGSGEHELRVHVYDERLPRARYRSGGDAPMFNNTEDGPYNVNVTEGESVTFNCQPFSVPEAAIVWLRNGKPIDTDNHPTRFVLSNDNRSLTIRDVCPDCLDQENETDRTLIQCNASNIHGYALAEGYLTVLMKTKVTIRGLKNVSVDFLEEKHVAFQCSVIADPSTSATIRWYKTEPFGDLVRSEPPYVNIENEFLIITIDPNCSAECVKYLGEYRCVGDNGYSQENRTITLSYLNRHLPETCGDKEGTWAALKIILVAGAIGLELLLAGIFLRSRLKLKQSSSDVNKQMRNRILPNPLSIYDDVGYDSVGFPLEELAGNKRRSQTIAYNMYDRIGYDSIDQIRKEIALREETMHSSYGVHAYNEYESIDEPERQAMACRPRPPLPDEGITRDDRLYPTSLGNATNGEYTGLRQVCRSESFKNEAENSPNSKSEALNTFLDVNREEVNSNSHFRKPDSNTNEVNSFLDLATTKVHHLFELVSTEVNPCLDIVDRASTAMDSYLDLVSTEENPCLEESEYMDLNPDTKEVNQYLDMGQREMNQYIELRLKEVNQNVDLDPPKSNQNTDPSPKEVNQFTDLGRREENQCTGQKELNQFMHLCPKEVN